MKRKYLLIVIPIIFLLALGGWLYARRPQRVAMASYVPESALGYLEINDWPLIVRRLTETTAWQKLAPAYGLDGRLGGQLNYLGQAGWLSRLVAPIYGGGEAAILARSQVAVVVSAIEVRGEEVRPRVALIAETHSRPSDLRVVIAERLPSLAGQIFKQTTQEKSEYGGVEIISYRQAPGSIRADRQLLSAQIEGEWILANHPDPLRACIDARLGRTPSMAHNFHLQTGRPIVERDGAIFGFMTADGLTRILRFGAFILSNSALRETGLIETLQDVLADLTARAADGAAYGVSFENGAVVDRYALLCKPDLVESLRPKIKPKPGELRSLNYIPPTMTEAMIVNVEDPNRTLDGIEAAVAGRIGAGQSFLLHQFMLGARDAFFGLKSDERTRAALGDEIAGFSQSSNPEDRVWLLAARDQGALRQLIERYLTQGGATIKRENYAGVELLVSSDARKGAAATLDDFAALGGRAPLTRLIETRSAHRSLNNSTLLTSAGFADWPAQPAAVLSFSSAKDESANLMLALTKWLGGSNLPAGNPPDPTRSAVLDQLPAAVSATTLNQKGVYIESRSPFGNFPFFVSITAGVIDGR